MGWRIDQQPASDAVGQIKGYASATSVNVGSNITFFVTVSPAQSYSMEIYRIGYYAGLGGRLMQRIGPLQGTSQPRCPMDARTGMIACRWAPSYHLSVPSTWTSGIYLAKLTNSDLFQNYIIFVVRDDSQKAALLYQQSVNTYQAYNSYPDDPARGADRPRTGKSLYEGGSSSQKTGFDTTRAVKVSFDRPYSSDNGAGNFLDWEVYYVRWLEQNGYDVTYSTDVDTDHSGARLRSFKGYLSVGHDEYWSRAMVDAVTDARDHGVGLGFFGANAIYWQIRYEPSSDGVPDRVIVCYKDAGLDPVQGELTTVRWRDRPVNRPEQQLVGVQYTSEQENGSPPAAFVAANTSNWLFAGTGMRDGDQIPGVVGYESDRYFSNEPMPAYVPGTFALISRSPFRNGDGAGDYQQSVVYQAASGSWVFGAGSIEWSWGLSDDAAADHADPRIKQITAHVLSRFLQGATRPPDSPTDLQAEATSAGAVDLDWAGKPKASELVLERSSDPTFAASRAIRLGPALTHYTDTGLAPGVYYYRIGAQSPAGNSPYSNVAAASTIKYEALIQRTVGLTSWWRLDERSGDTADDAAGTRSGTYGSAVTFGVPGAIAGDADTAVALRSTSPGIHLAAPSPVTDFSIEGWTRLDAAASTNTSGDNALYAGTGQVRILTRPGTATAAYAGVWLNGKEYVLEPDSDESNVGSWVQWVLTRAAGVLSLYRNGVQIAQRTDLPQEATAHIGGWVGSEDGSKYELKGGIDEVATYDRALSPVEVADHFTAATCEPRS